MHLYYGLILLAVIMLPFTPLHAWARHNLITKYILQNNEKYRNFEITVTEISPDDSINPEYIPIYINPDRTQDKVHCDQFINYDLEEGLYYGFEGRGIGEKTSIYEILVNFSDEPDWGMDRNLNLSFAQKFMAGSQGLRHMYYPFWSFHLPYPFVSQGRAPDRAQHFFERALREFKKGRYYSAYRELARSLHYVMDMAQPFHTYQLPPVMIQPLSPFNGTVQAIKNYHFAYETLVANLLQEEDCRGEYVLINYIVGAEPVSAEDARKLAIHVGIQSNKKAKALIPDIVRTLGVQFNQSIPRVLTKDEYLAFTEDEFKRNRVFLLTEESLELASGAVRGLIQLFERKVQKEEKKINHSEKR